GGGVEVGDGRAAAVAGDHAAGGGEQGDRRAAGGGVGDVAEVDEHRLPGRTGEREASGLPERGAEGCRRAVGGDRGGGVRCHQVQRHRKRAAGAVGGQRHGVAAGGVQRQVVEVIVGRDAAVRAD